MKNKGFTLIELLAVIVILAIIALIATPIILNIINSTKANADKESINLYKSAVEKAFVTNQLNGNSIPEGTYTSSEDGKILTNESTTINIDYKGNSVVCESIVYSNGKLTYNNCKVTGSIDNETLTYGNFTYKLKDGATTIINYDINYDNCMSDFEDEVLCNGGTSEENGSMDDYLDDVAGLIQDGYITNVVFKDDAVITGYNGSETTVIIPSEIDGYTVTEIGSNAFKGKSLTSVTIPNTITSIGSYAFDSNSLTTVSLPSELATLGDYAFSNNNLAAISVPSSLETISTGAFKNNNISSLSAEGQSGNFSIGESAFENNSFTTLRLSTHFTNVASKAFAGNQLTSVQACAMNLNRFSYQEDSFGWAAGYSNSNLTTCS